MDLVTLHLVYGDYEESVSLRVPDGYGKEVSGAFDDLMHDVEHETERFFYRMNDGTLETVLAYSEVHSGMSPKVKPKFCAIVRKGDWQVACDENCSDKDVLF